MSFATNRNKSAIVNKESGHQPYRSKRHYDEMMRLKTEKAAEWENSHPESELVRPYERDSYETMEYEETPLAGFQYPDPLGAFDPPMVQLPVPFFVPPEGRYTIPIEIRHSMGGVRITYTTDKTEPVEASKQFTSKIALTEKTTIKARAFLDGYIDSAVETGVFVFPSSSYRYVVTDMCQLSTGKILVVGVTDGTSDNGFAFIANVSGSQVTTGSVAVFDGPSLTAPSVCALSSTKALVTYGDYTDDDFDGEYPVYGCILTIDGDSITSGTSQQLFGDIVSGGGTAICALSETLAIVSYRVTTGTPGYYAANTLSISGDEITVNAAASPNPSTGGPISALSATKAVVTCSTGYAQVLSVSGTTITCGTAAQFFPTSISDHDSCALSDSLAIVVGGDQSGNGKACVLSVSGTTITPGSVVEFDSDSVEGFDVCPMSSTKAIVQYRDAVSYSGSYMPLSVSGTTVLTGVESEYSPNIGPASGPVICESSPTSVLVYYKTSTPPYLTPLVLTGFSWPFIAYPAASGDDGSTTVAGVTFENSDNSSWIGGDVPSGSSWTAHFDNSDWSAIAGSWDTDHWVSADIGVGHAIALSELGSWVEGYRPTKVRVTVSSSGGLVIQDSNSDYVYSSGAGTYDSLDEVTTTFTTYDMAYLLFSAPSSFTITNIEFYA